MQLNLQALFHRALLFEALTSKGQHHSAAKPETAITAQGGGGLAVPGPPALYCSPPAHSGNAPTVDVTA
jgi:hypothetical protein